MMLHIGTKYDAWQFGKGLYFKIGYLSYGIEEYSALSCFATIWFLGER
jgi:hypothetical protein